MVLTFKFGSVDLELVEGDITLIEADAIVNAAGARVEKSKFMDFIHGINEKVKASMNIQPKNS
jgi:hypothetical protein